MAKSRSKVEKINSPLARYNTLGQLICKICQTAVKSELVWSAHCQLPTHKTVSVVCCPACDC